MQRAVGKSDQIRMNEGISIERIATGLATSSASLAWLTDETQTDLR